MTISIIAIFYLATGAGVVSLLAAFAWTSRRESRPRAVFISLVFLFCFAVVWFGGFAVIPLPDHIMVIPMAIIAIFGLLFFMPLGNVTPLEIGTITGRVDERDVMFSREEYRPGTDKYNTYYAMRPENKEVDDRLRGLPELLAPGGKYYDPVRSPYVDAIFKVIHGMTAEVDGEVKASRKESPPEVMAPGIKQIVRHLGADEVGIARLNPFYLYSHVGRGPEPWGAPIINTHKFVIVFTLEMNYDQVESAPDLPITEASAEQYLRGTMISLALAQYIRDLGYSARAHISGSNYQLMLPPAAHDAGLGELGRHGYLISPRYGSRIRLGAVTTDLPLIADRPIVFGVQDFCDHCRRCADHCPSASIPAGDKSDVRGVKKWPLQVESCLRYWRLIGTDCGLCMKVCPFSHPPSPVHNLVRAGIKRSVFARRFSVWGEDIFYGKKDKS